MKNKVINAATCDAREVTEESLAGFEHITINSAILIVGERSRELLNDYSAVPAHPDRSSAHLDRT